MGALSIGIDLDELDAAVECPELVIFWKNTVFAEEWFDEKLRLNGVVGPLASPGAIDFTEPLLGKLFHSRPVNLFLAPHEIVHAAPVIGFQDIGERPIAFCPRR
jgi:hypothetical protein